MKNRGKPGKVRRIFAGLLIVALLLAGAYLLAASGFFEKIDSVEEIRALIDRSGPFAGAVYFVLQLLTVIIAPIPSNLSMMAGALALGFWPAMLLGIAAIWCGSMIVFLVARRLGRQAVQGWIDRGVMEKYLPLIEEKQDMFLFLTLLFPFFPDDVLCVLAGLTSIPTARFACLMLLARPWGLVFSALLGGGVITMPPLAWAVMGVVLIVAFVLAMKYARPIEEALLRFVSRISPKCKK